MRRPWPSLSPNATRGGGSRISRTSRGVSTPRASTGAEFESLAKAGAFDSLNPNRAQTFAAAEQLLRQASFAAEERESRQESLFAGIDPSFAPRPSLPLLDDWPLAERLQHEFSAIGSSSRATHSIATAESLERAGIIRFADLQAGLAANPTNRFKLAGIVSDRKERTTRHRRCS